MATMDKKDPTWVLVALTFGFIGVMYIFDKAIAHDPAQPSQYSEKSRQWQQFYQPPKECAQALTEEDQRRCDEFTAKALAKFEAEWQNGKLAGRANAGSNGHSCSADLI